MDRSKIPNVHEWVFDWFFSVAVFDLSLAKDLYFALAEFYSIAETMSLEEGYGVAMVNLDSWYFRNGYTSKVEKEYKQFKANLFLVTPGYQCK